MDAAKEKENKEKALLSNDESTNAKRQLLKKKKKKKKKDAAKDSSGVNKDEVALKQISSVLGMVEAGRQKMVDTIVC